MLRYISGAALVAALCASPLAAHDLSADRAALERDVRVLADDTMEGREAGTHGYAMAAGYVAGRFAAMGLEPGGEAGTYFQSVPLYSYKNDQDALKVNITRDDGTVIEGRAHIDMYGGGTARYTEGTLDAPLVFVGQGMQTGDGRFNDLSGVDLKGKIAVRVYGAPAGISSEEGAHFRSTWNQRLSDAGAVGSILLWSDKIEQRITFQKALENAEETKMTWLAKDGTPHDDGANLQTYLAFSRDLARKLMKGEVMDYDAIMAADKADNPKLHSFEMRSRARISYASTAETVSSNNVIAMLPGSDPELADEYVVLTGHLDHLGIKPTEKQGDDEIYNGAMDNATGISAMLEVACLMKANPVRRSVLFIALTAEEQGLLGSEYNAANPTVPADKVVANVNLDMPVLDYPFVDVVAVGAENSTLLAPVQAAASEFGIALAPDTNPEQGFFTRSDQYSYVKQGVPAVYLDLGDGNGGEKSLNAFLEKHYHEVSDEADLIDYEQLGRFAEINYLVARNIANMAERPLWNKGNFFGALFGGPMAD